MAADITSILSEALPTKEAITSSVGSMVVWGAILLIFVIILIIGAVGVFMIVRWIQFNRKIYIFEERDGKVEWVGEDHARELVYNLYGDSVFRLKKRKKFIPRGERKIAKKKYLYVIREDGEWINCELSSMEPILKQLGLKPIHPDMRAFKSAMVKIVKDTYEKKSLFKEWAPIIVPLIFFIIISIALYFVADRLVVVANTQNEVMVTAKEVLAETAKVISGLSNVVSSSGVRT